MRPKYVLWKTALILNNAVQGFFMQIEIRDDNNHLVRQVIQIKFMKLTKNEELTSVYTYTIQVHVHFLIYKCY